MIKREVEKYFGVPDEKSYYFILVFFFLSKAKLSSKLFLLQASFNKKWCLGCQFFFSHKLESRSSVQLKRQENNGYPSRYWYFGIFLAREYLEKSGISVSSDGVPFAYSFILHLDGKLPYVLHSCIPSHFFVQILAVSHSSLQLSLESASGR